MLKLFEYNWQVRNDWFTWCEDLPQEELVRERTGGVGSILYTLFHIVDVEYSWCSVLQGKPDPQEPPFEEYRSLQSVRDLSNRCHEEVETWIRSWTDEMEDLDLTLPNFHGGTSTYKFGEVIRHTAAHEIHHMGQLSIWARELGRAPVTANLINRGLYE